MDVLTEAKTLIGRPHVIIATSERVKVLLEENSNIQVEQHTNERSKPYIKGNYGDWAEEGKEGYMWGRKIRKGRDKQERARGILGIKILSLSVDC